jgi:hypothetical protein
MLGPRQSLKQNSSHVLGLAIAMARKVAFVQTTIGTTSSLGNFVTPLYQLFVDSILKTAFPTTHQADTKLFHTRSSSSSFVVHTMSTKTDKPRKPVIKFPKLA